MDDTCTICGLWRGLHEWDTMRCPANGHEDGQFQQTVYTPENSELTALRAERDELAKQLAAEMLSSYRLVNEIDNLRAILARYEAQCPPAAANGNSA